MKALHAKWLVEAYKHMTYLTDREICLKGWIKSGISKASENGSNEIFTHAAIENEMQQDQVDSFVGSIKTTYRIDNLEYDPTVTYSLYLTSKATND